ncbi:helix-turn-helix domain-containing protein [Bosea eneae]|uniref:Helix-turn-helix domain-containing protein n=1 Tax=Bosea eneae TaxID=151454 RepID=A0ABW0IY36_9HYPH
MKLAEYLRTRDMKPAEFARIVGTHRQNVSRWMNGIAVPRPDDLRKILEVTDGKVTPNDFITLAEAS